MKKATLRIIKYSIIMLIVVAICGIPTKNFADVGSFETYDDSSWDSDYSSSYDYDDDYDDDYDYDSDSDYNYTTELNSTEIIIFILIAVVLVIVKSNKNNRKPPLNYNNYQPITEQQENVEEKVKLIDELFNEEEFLAWVKDLFVKLQEAWTARDWSTIRYFESNELFEQHQKQLQGYIDNHQINKMERICVKSAKLLKFEQTGDIDVLTVILNSKMIDYIIDDRTQEIIKGDKATDRHSTYKMVFIRKSGVKTKEKINEINTTNCPNCSAPTQITSSGKCEYCGSVITTGEFNWVLSNLEKIG